MIKGKVSCLMATAWRPAFVRRAVECFARQDYPNRELIILNNHTDPISFDHTSATNGSIGLEAASTPGIRITRDGARIRIIGEPSHPTLGDCRNRLLCEADGEFLRIWDDDDLYFPWCISQGIERIGDAPAWKPTRSWWCDGSGQANGYSQPPGTFALASNAMEASITWRTQAVRDAGGWYPGQGNESQRLLQRMPVAHEDMGIWPGYCYMHGCGQFHASATIGDGRDEAKRSAEWQSLQRSVTVPSYLEECRRLVRFIEPRAQTGWMKAALGQGPAHVPAIDVRQLAKPRHNPLWTPSRLVVAPGCWDLLHDGHVKTLEWAAQQGDMLQVLVNDDAGVASQKGPGRPLVPFAGRIASLEALDFVRAVYIVEGRDDLPVLEVLHPDILVKGPEYAGREASIPHPPGCEVLIAPASPFTAHTSDLAVSSV